MWNDPIVEEVRRIREEHAARFGNDLDAIYDDFKKRGTAVWSKGSILAAEKTDRNARQEQIRGFKAIFSY